MVLRTLPIDFQTLLTNSRTLTIPCRNGPTCIRNAPMLPVNSAKQDSTVLQHYPFCNNQHFNSSCLRRGVPTTLVVRRVGPTTIHPKPISNPPQLPYL
jgi:hypothetical protein